MAEQLSFAIAVDSLPPAARPGPRGGAKLPQPADPVQPSRAKEAPALSSQLDLPLQARPRLPRVVEGGGAGTGHRRGRLIALQGGGAATPARQLLCREEITAALLGALADLVAGRISAVAATAIREAAEDALRQLEASQRDPHLAPRFARASRALQELLPLR